ncbi:hypothetical protein [Flagellimonas allohymeniacidonis]|uniref:TonB-dependent receptor plug domain-containing protein n=1 Tax=Flagellimonas allohymeniacidonis TaxID=2517819 RepID=A0A4Q8QIW0_9FLAO|nr:hypothetical protein [Allomuricauda hymeniacidonis]TAI48653.1 hypothetical protein EW142_02310 [Allomuricauda hymeniacidonis]
MKKFFTLLFFIVCITSGISQERLIQGKVINGQSSLDKVDIQVLNKGISETTTNDGSYKIVADIGDVLFYSAEGMESVQIRVEDVTRILNVEMFPRIEKLDNVTVTKSRNNTQKELELLYRTNPNIIKTAFGYLDKSKASYTARILQDEQILPGEFDLANVLRNRFPGIRVSDGFGFGRGPLETQGTGFSGLNGFGNGRAVFLRSGWPALFDIDGQIFTNFPDFIDVQNISRMAVIPSAAGTVRYGNLGRGGVIVINTKTGTPELVDNNGLPIDIARRTDNFYNGDALNEETISKNAPTYLKELRNAATFTEAKDVMERNSSKYSSSPYFTLDAYQYFADTWKNQSYADQIIDNAYSTMGNNPVHLKSLAYIYESQGRLNKAEDALREVFILRPQYSQSYLDLAKANRNLGNMDRAAILYARYFYLLDEGFMQLDTTAFSTIVNREFNNFLALEKTEIAGAVKNSKLKIDKEDFEGTRLFFEWSDSEAEFELQFVNPDGQYYTWKHTLKDNAKDIRREKDFGFSCSEYLIDNSISGVWKVNVNYLGNKSLTPSYLKATVYYNYGTKAQRKDVMVFKLDIKNANRELFKVENISANVSR